MNAKPIIGLLAIISCWSGTAQAKCDSLLRSLSSYSSDRLVSQYKRVIACDTKVANQVFPQFMREAGDADTLIALSLAAIDHDIWNPVWEMLGKISSYEARDEVASRIGMTCNYNTKVVGFIQGAYYGLRDIEFGQWDDALLTCESQDFEDWLIKQVEDPPPKLYDEKWSALADALAQRLHAGSLPHLARGAIVAASNGGPFDAILMKMEAAVDPPLGEEMLPSDRKALDESLLGMARQLDTDKARAVADRLANSGSDALAADLLPVVYPGRRKGGRYEYGGASIEAGTCDGEQTAILHYAILREPGKRWIIMQSAEEPLRSFKPRLSKCEIDEPWPIVVSPEPMENNSAMSTWIDEITKNWEDKGYTVKLREEKPLDI